MKHKLLIASLLLSLCCMAQKKGKSEPINIQVLIFSVDKIEGRNVEMRGTNLAGDTIYLKYGCSSKFFAKKMKPGMWVTITTYASDPTCEWVERRMKINN